MPYNGHIGYCIGTNEETYKRIIRFNRGKTSSGHK